MSIKFRCSECEHGIKAPDTAAGKGVKCPKCGKKLRVPSGARKKKSQKKKEPDSGDSAEFLANLDMDKIARDDVELCQKCAAQLPEDETACPECGFDPDHLTTAGRRRKKMADKGIDPATYYEELWRDPFAFTFAHTGMVFKTGSLLTLFFLIASLCAYFVVWVATVPPFGFWVLVTVVSLLIPIGWLLTVQLEVIQLALEKKDVIKKIRFDFAQCGMYGIKFLAWVIVFGLPFWIVFGGLGVLLDYSGVPNGLLIGASLALVPILLLMPQGMSHLSMPVEQPGWFLHKIFPTLRLSFMPGVMWAVLFLVVMLPVAGAAATVYFVGGDKFEAFAEARIQDGKVHTAKVMLDIAEDASSEDYKNELIEKYTEAAEEELIEKDWTSIILPVVLGIFACYLMGFASLVLARANGIFASNLKRGLNLIGSAKEKKYVKKETEDKIRTRKTTIPAPALIRFAAHFIDALIIEFCIGSFLGIIFYLLITLEVDFENFWVLVGVISGMVFCALLGQAFYFANGESGMEQATPGKKMFNLYVCDDQYRPLSTLQGWGRYLVFVLSSALISGLGSLTVFFREDKKTLHDIVTGTQVRMDKPKKVKKTDDEKKK